VNSDITKYYFFSAVNNCLFFLPVVYIFFQQDGLSLTEIFAIEAIYSLGIVLFEVPTGAVADRFGKKASLLAGSLFLILSCLLFSISSGFLALSAAYLVWAFGASLGSGADTALLYDILHKGGQEEYFKRYRANATVFGLSALALSGIIGGYLASISMRMTFVASAVAFALSFIVLSTIKHAESRHENESYRDIVTGSFRLIKNSPLLLWRFAYLVLFRVVYCLVQPSTQIYMGLAGLGITFFGVASALLFLSGLIGSKVAHGFESRFKTISYAIIAALSVLSLLLASQYVVPLGFLVFALLYFAESMNSILIEHEMLKNTPKKWHSTVLSFGSMSSRLALTLLAPIWGVSMQGIGLQATFFGSAIILAIASAFLFLLYTGIREHEA